MEALVLLVILVPLVILVLYFLNCIKILREYDRGVIFYLGRLLPVVLLADPTVCPDHAALGAG